MGTAFTDYRFKEQTEQGVAVTELKDLTSYSDIRKVVSPDAFRQALSYISWHNRLAYTDMLHPWEALVVAMAYEGKQIDGFMYSGLKSFLDSTRDQAPDSIEECRHRSEKLLQALFQG